MSSDWVKLLGAVWGDDPKQIELIENITEKTKSGKIIWEKTPGTLVANVPGMQLSFVPATSFAAILGGGGAWDIFSIRNLQGSEIMKVEQSVGNIFLTPAPSPAPSPRSKLLQAVDALYSVAEAKGQVSELDKAIHVIKNL
jgi:hypothetical protein